MHKKVKQFTIKHQTACTKNYFVNFFHVLTHRQRRSSQFCVISCVCENSTDKVNKEKLF